MVKEEEEEEYEVGGDDIGLCDEVIIDLFRQHRMTKLTNLGVVRKNAEGYFLCGWEGTCIYEKYVSDLEVLYLLENVPRLKQAQILYRMRR